MKAFDSQKLLTAYSGVLTLGVAVALLSGFSTEGGSPRFDTITVQRINVVEPDGTLRMVLSNNRRIPAIIVNGREYPDFTGRKGSTTAGILFYDAQATESGGLTFGGRQDAQGNISRFGHLSFDRYNQDQMFTIDAIDDGTNHSSSIRILDQPSWSIEELLQLLESIQHLPPEEQQAAIDKFFETHPLSAGLRTVLSNETNLDSPSESRNVLHFRDASGQDRLRLGLDANGVPSLEVLDESGNVTHRLPPNGA